MKIILIVFLKIFLFGIICYLISESDGPSYLQNHSNDFFVDLFFLKVGCKRKVKTDNSSSINRSDKLTCTSYVSAYEYVCTSLHSYVLFSLFSYLSFLSHVRYTRCLRYAKFEKRDCQKLPRTLLIINFSKN